MLQVLEICTQCYSSSETLLTIASLHSLHHHLFRCPNNKTRLLLLFPHFLINLDSFQLNSITFVLHLMLFILYPLFMTLSIVFSCFCKSFAESVRESQYHQQTAFFKIPSPCSLLPSSSFSLVSFTACSVYRLNNGGDRQKTALFVSQPLFPFHIPQLLELQFCFGTSSI